MAGLNFENALMSCKVQDGVNKFDAEGQCAWSSMGGRRIERQDTASNVGFDQTTTGLSGGVQVRLSDNVFGGLAGSWENLSTEANDSSSSTGQRLQGGAVLKGVWDNTTLALAFTAGMSSQDTSRTVALPLGPVYRLEGTQNIGFASAHARLAQSFGSDDWYVKPMVDLGITQISVADFSETGGPMALDVQGHDDLYVTVAPSIEIGGQADFGEDAVVRAYARLGLLGVPVGSDPTITAGFADAPDGVEPFTITGDIDEWLYDVTLGVDVIASNGTVVRMSGDAKVGDTIQAYGGSIKVSAPF
jgi:outer membrane autotransporter protein